MKTCEAVRFHSLRARAQAHDLVLVSNQRGGFRLTGQRGGGSVLFGSALTLDEVESWIVKVELGQ